ncbi:MAG: AbrB/MazE/SpoVT family DNA-binding domain-containing protein [Candidatus Sigynarchaeota archaeon]
MVINVTIDSQGRILIPVEIRGKLHLEPNSELELTILGNELILRKSNTNLERQVMSWKQQLMDMKIEAGVVQEEPDDTDSEKWMDRDYVKKKLGID